MTLRGALLGCGQVSYFHLTAWGAINEARIGALYNRTRSRAEARAEEFGIPLEHVYDDIQTLFNQEKLDFVDIATAPHAHYENVLAALDRGIPVLCQKPLAPSLKDAQEMVSAAERAGILFAVNENWRWRSWYRKLKELIVSDIIGPPNYIRIARHSNITLPTRDGEPPPLASKQPYTTDLDKLIVYEWGTHILDTLRFLLGEITSVYAHMDHVSPHFLGEDRVLMILKIGEASVCFDASWASPETESELLEEVRIEGESGVIDILTGNQGHILVRADDHVEKYPAYKGTSEEAYQASYTAAQEHFIQCLISGETPETVATDNLETLKATFAAYESAEKGRIVALTDT